MYIYLIKLTKMKVLLDITDSKAPFIMELLKSFPYIKTQTITPAKARFIQELKEAVANVKLAKSGKLKARPAKDLLDEI
jgi:hypothetical protein